MRCFLLFSNVFGGIYEDFEKLLFLICFLKVMVCEMCEARVRILGGKLARRVIFNVYDLRGVGLFLSLYVILSVFE